MSRAKKSKKTKRRPQSKVTKSSNPRRSVKKSINPWKAFSLKDKWTWLGILFVLLLTALLYNPGLKHEFTNWDDNVYVTENRYIKDFSSENIKHLFTKPLAGNYHPITMFTLMINHQVSDSFASFYIGNVLLHLLNCFLVFYFIYVLSNKKRWVALFTSLVFAIHPMHIESVAWISERKDVLYTCFFLLSLISYQFSKLSGHKKYGLISLLFFALSILSKPAAIVLPGVLVLLDFYKSRKITLSSVLKKWPYFLIAIVLTIITLRTQAEAGATISSDFSLLQRIMITCYIPFAYLYRFFIPEGLSAFYPYPASNAIPFIIQLSPLFFVGLGAGLFVLRRKAHIVVFGLLFFLLNIFLIMQIKMVGEAMLADRYTYIPYIGLAFSLGMLLDKYISSRAKNWRLLPVSVMVIFCTLLFIISSQRLTVWQNSGTLFSDVIDKYPNFYKAYISRGRYNHKTNPDKALMDYNRALELKANHIAFNNRANIYLDRGEYNAAIQDYSNALKIKPGFAPAHGNRAGAYFMMSDYEKAIEDYNISLQLNPNIGLFVFNRSRCLNRLNRKKEALQDALRAKALGYPVPDNYLKGLQK
jgi:tetratricopeptide (TPR) repeat protein